VEIKFLEIRDVGKAIPALAVQFTGDLHPLLADAGFDPKETYVLLVTLSDIKKPTCQIDPYAWGNKTLNVAHQAVQQTFADVTPDVHVDVPTVLEQSQIPVVTTRVRKSLGDAVMDGGRTR
jgi:hypothetical protein